MNKEEKSQLLHDIAKSAEDEVLESRHPKPAEKSEEEVDSERKEQANDLSDNAIEIANMSFSAKDLKDFSALSAQSASKTFEQPKSGTEAAKAGSNVKPPRKDFYEEIFDKKNKKWTI